MAKTATAEQRARQRTREWRTRLASEQAEQDRRIRGAVATVLAGQDQVRAAGEALVAAQQQALGEAGVAVRALKAEGLPVEEIAQLTGLGVTGVRKALKVEVAGQAEAAPISPVG